MVNIGLVHCLPAQQSNNRVIVDFYVDWYRVRKGLSKPVLEAMEIDSRCAILSWPTLLAYCGSKGNTQGLLQLAKWPQRTCCRANYCLGTGALSNTFMWGVHESTLHVASLWKLSAITILKWWNERAIPGNLSSGHFLIEASYNIQLANIVTDWARDCLYVPRKEYLQNTSVKNQNGSHVFVIKHCSYNRCQSLKRHKGFYHPVTALFFTFFDPSPLSMGSPLHRNFLRPSERHDLHFLIAKPGLTGSCLVHCWFRGNVPALSCRMKDGQDWEYFAKFRRVEAKGWPSPIKMKGICTCLNLCTTTVNLP